MGKKGFLLIDGAKNAVVLNMDEMKQLNLGEYLMEHDVIAQVRQHKTRAELNKSIGQYLKNEWEEVQDGET